MSSYLDERIAKTKYSIDGIIITGNKKYPLNTEKYPKYAIAFKTSSVSEIAETTVLNIKWKLTKEGYYSPILVSIGAIIFGYSQMKGI